ncbi:MAG: hypothetical protein WCL49_12970, partial [bacterium]
MNAELGKKKTCGCSCKRKTAQAATGGATGDGLDRATEYHRIIESFDVLSVPRDIQALVREALDSKHWDWFQNCDGCTCVSEMYWPTK